MLPDPPFQDLMARLRNGDQEAAALIFQRFAHRLVALARSRLSPLLRAKIDPEDVLQTALRSFFRGQAEGRLEVESWDSLWSLLTVITLRKCGRRVEHFRAACRDVRREADVGRAEEDSAASWEAVARDPTPAEAMVLAETVGELVRGLSDRDRRIVELSLQGEGIPEVAAEIGCSERTVERVLQRLRERLERMRDGPADAGEPA
jgi:RNA polymerase sigma-70 factor (ECF subfamily)